MLRQAERTETKTIHGRANENEICKSVKQFKRQFSAYNVETFVTSDANIAATHLFIEIKKIHEVTNLSLLFVKLNYHLLHLSN